MNPEIVSPRARALTPYTPGEQPQNRKYIKLNTNENPYPPAPAAAELLSRYSAESLRLYPDPRFGELRAALAAWYGLDPEEVFLGNGSDEILSFAFYSFFDPAHGPVLFPQHTYSFYPVFCTFYDLPFRRIPLRDDFSVELEDYLDVRSHAGMVIANPNAPTGMSLDRIELEAFLKRYRQDRICIIDEAYVDFGGESCAELIREYSNLLVVHTFSKSRSLAGLRVGFALGNPQLIETLFTVKDSFNSYPLNRLSQEIAVAALQDRSYFDDIRRRIMTTRSSVSSRMSAMGWTVLPSRANFIFASLPGVEGERIYTRLKENGILVRHFKHPGIEEYVRITIGTDGEMDRFIEMLQSLDFVRR